MTAAGSSRREVRGMDMSNAGATNGSDPHLVTTVAQLEALYDKPFGGSMVKEIDHVNAHYRAFIEAAPMASTARPAATRRASCAFMTRRRCSSPTVAATTASTACATFSTIPAS